MSARTRFTGAFQQQRGRYHRKIKFVRTGQLQQITHHIIQTLYLLSHDARDSCLFPAFRAYLLKETGKALYGAERIAYLMRYACGKMPQCGKSVLTPYFRLKTANLSQITEHKGIPRSLFFPRGHRDGSCRQCQRNATAPLKHAAHFLFARIILSVQKISIIQGRPQTWNCLTQRTPQHSIRRQSCDALRRGVESCDPAGMIDGHKPQRQSVQKREGKGGTFPSTSCLER